MKLQYKIIYLLTGLFIVYTLAFGAFIYYSISEYAFTDFYKRLEIRAAAVAKIRLDLPGDAKSIREIQTEYLEQLPEQKSFITKVSGSQIEDNDTIPSKLYADVVSEGKGKYNSGSIFFSGIKYKAAKGNEYVVVVSAENYFYSHHIVYLRNLLFSSLLYAIILIIIISLLISRTFFQPIRRLIAEMTSISSENLHLRLHAPERDDDMSNLVSAFNDMLNRLETSFETQKNFISNASHELNTPLTSIIAEADIALSRERDIEEYKSSLQNIMMEAEKLETKTKALLFLAQTGYNGKAQKFDKIRVDQLILDVRETVQKINSDFKISLDFSLLPESPVKLKIKGNEQLLHLAISNILVNGCKYSDKQTVQLALGASDKEVIIVVKDKGIGIPNNELKYIYDPYFRASNTSNYEGYGIGLPLTRNIIRMHNGTLNVFSIEGEGTTVEIRIPLGNYTI